MPPLDSAEDDTEAFEARDVVAREEAVDVRQRCTHPPGKRLVLDVALERVHPDDGERLAREARHFAPGQLRIAALAAVGEDDDDGAAGQCAPPPLVVVGLERLADPRSAR